MSDITKRTSAWKAKHNPERIKQTLDAMHEQMTQRYEAAMADMYQMEIKVKEVLNESGVHTIIYVPYLNYARQIYKLSHSRNINGDSLALDAAILLDKWAARGLDREVLSGIRFKVFNIRDTEK